MKKNKKKEQIDIELTEQKAGFEMMKMLLTLDEKVNKKKTRKILLWLTSLRACKSKLMRNIFKKVTGWLFDDCGIVPNEKKIKNIFLEVISNTKIIYIKFCSMNLPTTKILPNLQED